MKALFKIIKNGAARFFSGADIILFVLCSVSSLFGLALVSSAAQTYSNPLRYILMQGVALVAGIGAYVLFSFIDLEHISALWKWIAAFNLLAVGALRVFGTVVGGNRAWLRIGPFSLQPAELVKVTFILLMACHMYALRDVINRPLPMLSLAAHALGYAGALLLVSEDMGNALVFLFIFIIMLVASGVRFWWFLIAGGVLTAVWPLIWSRLFSEGQRARILIVINPESDPGGAGYHYLWSRRAVSGGGIFGQGLYRGAVSQSTYLFAKESDFIFSVCAEELGLVGCLLLIGFLAAIMARCLYVCTQAKSPLSMLFCAGVFGWMFFQTFENIGMCIGITPVIGLTLPFFSYGGTSVIAIFTAAGMVSGVYMRPIPDWLKN